MAVLLLLSLTEIITGKLRCVVSRQFSGQILKDPLWCYIISTMYVRIVDVFTGYIIQAG